MINVMYVCQLKQQMDGVVNKTSSCVECVW